MGREAGGWPRGEERWATKTHVQCPDLDGAPAFLSSLINYMAFHSLRSLRLLNRQVRNTPTAHARPTLRACNARLPTRLRHATTTNIRVSEPTPSGAILQNHRPRKHPLLPNATGATNRATFQLNYEVNKWAGGNCALLRTSNRAKIRTFFKVQKFANITFEWKTELSRNNTQDRK